MRVICDANLCQGHGRCEATAPEVYKLDDNGYLGGQEFAVPPGREEEARLGAESCPEGAIKLVEN
jgi:ferredoxin